MAKIGIGVTTYNRPECLKKCTDQIYKHTDKSNLVFYIARDTDADRKGVAFRKNECLRALKDCDYIFLFDDDCYPIKDGWIDFFVRKDRHVLFMNEKIHGNPIITFSSISQYYDCGGVFMYIRKEDLNKVGAFNEKFTTWGFEHAEWSVRCQDGERVFFMIQGTEEYLYAADYSDPNHKSSISNEEKKKYFDLNFPKFKEPIKDTYIPL